MGYCIIIVANIINIQLIDTCITCFAFSGAGLDETARREDDFYFLFSFK